MKLDGNKLIRELTKERDRLLVEDHGFSESERLLVMVTLEEIVKAINSGEFTLEEDEGEINDNNSL